jgi:mRNA interferase MazF
MAPDIGPERGHVWLAFLDPVVGHEQGGRRPVLVVSSDAYHEIPSRLLIILPITSRDRRIASHIPVSLIEGSLARRSFAICEQPRAISQERLLRRIGRADQATIDQTMIFIRLFLDL